MKFPGFMWFPRNWSCCRISLFCCSSDVILSESVSVYCTPKNYTQLCKDSNHMPFVLVECLGEGGSLSL